MAGLTSILRLPLALKSIEQLERSEHELGEYFERKVVPLRERMRKLTFDDIPEHELHRFMFVMEHGGDRWRFFEAVEKLTPFQLQHLRSYIDRAPAALH